MAKTTSVIYILYVCECGTYIYAMCTTKSTILRYSSCGQKTHWLLGNIAHTLKTCHRVFRVTSIKLRWDLSNMDVHTCKVTLEISGSPIDSGSRKYPGQIHRYDMMWPRDVMWRRGSFPASFQILVYCLVTLRYYRNQYLYIVNWIIQKKIKWNRNIKRNILFQWEAFENVWSISVILFRSHCVNRYGALFITHGEPLQDRISVWNSSYVHISARLVLL